MCSGSAGGTEPPAGVSSQVTVSSGGMLTQKLNADDLQFEKGAFDGTAAYAQNKVRDILRGKDGWRSSVRGG